MQSVKVCEQDDRIWVQCPASPDLWATTLNRLPGRCYEFEQGGPLTRVGQRVPSAELPAGPWVELQKWMQLEVATPSFGGVTDERVRLKMVRSAFVEEPDIVLTSMKEWQRVGLAAPDVRLRRWSFAVSSDRRVIVRGTPLPVVQGCRYIEKDGLATEAGWTWSPRVSASVLIDLLGIESDDLALLSSDGSWTQLKSRYFVRATRSAIRASAASQNQLGVMHFATQIAVLKPTGGDEASTGRLANLLLSWRVCGADRVHWWLPDTESRKREGHQTGHVVIPYRERIAGIRTGRSK